MPKQIIWSADAVSTGSLLRPVILGPPLQRWLLPHCLPGTLSRALVCFLLSPLLSAPTPRDRAWGRGLPSGRGLGNSDLGLSAKVTCPWRPGHPMRTPRAHGRISPAEPSTYPRDGEPAAHLSRATRDPLRRGVCSCSLGAAEAFQQRRPLREPLMCSDPLKRLLRLSSSQLSHLGPRAFSRGPAHGPFSGLESLRCSLDGSCLCVPEEMRDSKGTQCCLTSGIDGTEIKSPRGQKEQTPPASLRAVSGITKEGSQCPF